MMEPAATQKPTKKARGSKVTNEQINALVDFLGLPQNKSILTLKPHPCKANEVTKLWQSATQSLNKLKGPKKTSEEWRRFFVELKSRTKKKARTIRSEQCGGPPETKPLTDLEEKLMSLIGWVSVTGCQGLPDEDDPLEDAVEEERHEYENVELDVPEQLSDDNSLSFDHNHTESWTPKQPTSQPTINKLPRQAQPLDGSLSPTISIEGLPPKQPRVNEVPRRPHQQIRRKPKSQTNRNSSSGVSLLHESAKFYSEGSDKMCNAIIHMGDAITHFGNAVQQLATALSNYTILLEKLNTVQIVEEADQEMSEAV